jgi:hypothetical protein
LTEHGIETDIAHFSFASVLRPCNANTWGYHEANTYLLFNTRLWKRTSIVYSSNWIEELIGQRKLTIKYKWRPKKAIQAVGVGVSFFFSHQFCYNSADHPRSSLSKNEIALILIFFINLLKGKVETRRERENGTDDRKASYLYQKKHA